MIGQLTGVARVREPGLVILDVAGVGYKLAVTHETQNALPKDDSPVTLWTHLAVRENALDLYGFATREELSFFELIITISGIGPKKAIAILSLAPLAVLREAIVKKDASYLTKVAGVGRKNAEKIVLELHDKLGALGATDEESPALQADSDVLEAVRALGYSLQEAREAVKRVPNSVTGINDRIKEALRQMGK